MSRHPLDHAAAPPGAARLLAFLRIARRIARPPQHPALARGRARRATPGMLARFCRIDRFGPGRV